MIPPQAARPARLRFAEGCALGRGSATRARRASRLSLAWAVLLPVGTLAALLPAPAAAHPGVPPAPHDVWAAWPAEPLPLLGLAVVLLLFDRGVAESWRRAGRGRVFAPAALHRGGVGLLVIGAALLTPLDAVAGALFSAHMVQHLLLVAAAAPLLVAGDAGAAVFRGLPRRARRAVGRGARRTGLLRAWAWLRNPAPAWLFHAGVLWLWHLPRMYDAALATGWVHALEHATMTGSAILFWIPVLSPRRRVRVHGGVGLLYLFTFAMQASLLSALLTFSRAPWFAGHVGGAGAWGLTPLEDQQLAGVIMWVPGGAVYLLAGALVFLRWMGEMDARAPSLAPRAGP